MSIKSDAFGRVTLTEEDARKFAAQVRYGRPKKAAVESVSRGVEAVRAFNATGSIAIGTKRKKPEHARG